MGHDTIMLIFGIVVAPKAEDQVNNWLHIPFINKHLNTIH